MVDDKWIMSGHWLGSVLPVSFTAVTFARRLQGNPAHKSHVSVIFKGSFLEQVMKEILRETANPSSLGSAQLSQRDLRTRYVS